MKCIDCGSETARQKRRCPTCQDKRDIVVQEERRVRELTRQRAIRAANPLKCREPGCNNEVIGHKHRCDACQRKLNSQRQMAKVAKDRQLDAVAIIPVKPPPPKKVMSQKEYDEINSRHLNEVLAGQRDLDRRFIAFPPASQDKIRAMMMRRATV